MSRVILAKPWKVPAASLTASIDEMPDAAGHRCLKQRPAFRGIVVIIFQRVLDRFRHDDRSGEMHDRADAAFGKDAGKQRPVRNVPFIQGHTIRHGKAETGGQIVDHGNVPALINQSEDGMAANIAGTAGNEDGRSVSHVPALASVRDGTVNENCPIICHS